MDFSIFLNRDGKSLIGCVQNKCSGTNCYNCSVLNAAEFLIAKDFVFYKCTGQTRSVMQCVDEFSSFLGLSYIDDAMSAVHAHV